MKSRLTYPDNLKGLAIILVVMGHIIGSMSIYGPIIHFIDSFHMPLFMFLSGIFAFKVGQKIDKSAAWAFLKKKCMRVLVPFAVIGGGNSLIISYLYGGDAAHAIGGYWFLPALFYCMLLGLGCMCIKQGLGKRNWWKDLMVDAVLWGVLSVVYFKFNPPIPFYLAFVKMYPFYALGIYFSQYEWLKQKMTSSGAWYGAAAVAYLALWFCPYHLPISLTGFCAIIILLQLFIKHEAAMPRVLQTVGQHSLEIYLLHWFFLPGIQFFSVLKDCVGDRVIPNANFVITGVIALAVAIPIIFICIMLAKALHHHKWLRKVVGG